MPPVSASGRPKLQIPDGISAPQSNEAGRPARRRPPDQAAYRKAYRRGVPTTRHPLVPAEEGSIPQAAGSYHHQRVRPADEQQGACGHGQSIQRAAAPVHPQRQAASAAGQIHALSHPDVPADYHFSPAFSSAHRQYPPLLWILFAAWLPFFPLCRVSSLFYHMAAHCAAFLRPERLRPFRGGSLFSQPSESSAFRLRREVIIA